MKILKTEEIVSKVAHYPTDVTYDLLENCYWVKLEDVKKELEDIINFLPKYSCDIDSSIIGDLIKRLENAK